MPGRSGADLGALTLKRVIKLSYSGTKTTLLVIGGANSLLILGLACKEMITLTFAFLGDIIHVKT